MADLAAFLKTIVSGILMILQAYFDLTVFGINFGALFVIGIVVSVVTFLIWGRKD